MLTFTSAVGKLNVRVLWHHHMLLQVISQRYCQVFVKSYNFVFGKIDKEGSPREPEGKYYTVPIPFIGVMLIVNFVGSLSRVPSTIVMFR